MQQRPGTPIGRPAGPVGQPQPQPQRPTLQPPQQVQPQMVQPQMVSPQMMSPQMAQQMAAQQMAAQQMAAQQMAAQQQAQQGPPAVSVTGGVRPGMANPNDPNLKPIERLFALMAQYDSSDLHLKSGSPVIMRIKGDMRALQGNPLSSEEIYRLLKDIVTEEQLHTYDTTGDLDFAHRLPDQARSRFRLNVFRDRGKNALVARRISTEIPTFEQLNLPKDSLVRILDSEDGLIVLAGVTGSGKSTTIAGMIDYVNSHDAKHIITVEDPIEYEFKNKRSFISQREIGTDCKDFKAAIRTLVRQDPDLILIGEMRDMETFEFGMIAAETGHLVFGTLHAGTVAQSIGRIIGLFPADKHGILRQGLSFNLRAIVCQKLAPSQRFGRVPINEIMICSPIVKKILADGEDSKLTGIISSSKQDGMMTFDQCILDRWKAGAISDEVAMEYATNPDQMRMKLQGIDLGSGGLAM
ncbi:MAG: type IV pilus twitching motility protein PilT [Planctomycetota bacterium]